MTSKQSIQVVFQQLQQDSKKLKQLQSQIEQLSNPRMQLQTQLQENTSVEHELSVMEPEAKLFKKYGFALILQDLFEAKQLVSNRLKKIKEQIENIEKQGDEFLKEREEIRKRIQNTQMQHPELFKQKE